MKQEEKIENFAFYIAYLFKKTKLAREKCQKNNVSYDETSQIEQITYIKACEQFKQMCEDYYHENLSAADYFRKVISEREERNERIYEGTRR